MKMLAVAALALALIPITAAAENVVWQTTEHNFGTVTEGDSVKYSFVFENHSESLLTIKSAKPSCGCTVSNYTEEVPPGGQGWIDARIDTSGMKGEITKTIRVKTSAGDYLLRLTGQVN